MKKIFFLVTFFLFTSLYSQTEEPITEDQAQFIRALAEVNQNPALSIQLLEDLYKKTPTIRIELELARAYFALGDYEESRLRFIEILEKDIPPLVRNNVEIFLRRINENLTPLTISVNAVYDSNPMAVTSTESIRLFGLEFDYNPQFVKQEEWGLQSRINYQKRLTPRMQTGFNFDYSQYQTSEHKRGSLRPYLSMNGILSPRLSIIFSGVYESFSSEHLRDALSVNANLNLGIHFGTRINLFSSIENSNYDQFKYLDGSFKNIGFQFTKRLFENTNLEATLAADYSDPKDISYKFDGRRIQLNLTQSNLPMDLEFGVNIAHSERDYEGLQPFFATYRDDALKSINLSLTKLDFYIFGVRPSISWSLQENSSNIDIMSYERDYFSIDFIKVY